MPIAISLAMALSIQGLKKNNILIKKLEAIQVCGMLHDVCISKSGTLTNDKMSASMVHFKGSKAVDVRDVANQREIANQKSKGSDEFLSDYFRQKTKINHDQALIELLEDVIVGGTNSWLDINDHPSKSIDGHKKAKKKNQPPENPVYEPRGDSIENASLQFLIDAQEDVTDMFNFRNKWQRVLCGVPFSSREKFKITAIN